MRGYSNFTTGGRGEPCPVAPFERAGEGYASRVGEWLANPHAYFRAFGREAREFQLRHPSERLRTMTLVSPAGELARFRPVCVCVDRLPVEADSWETVFSLVTSRLVAAHPKTFAALQRAGELAWLGCPFGGAPVADAMETGLIKPQFSGWDEVVYRVQWLFLMCGIRLNEVIVQVDPYTDEQWAERLAALQRKRADDAAFMAGRRAAQKAWAEAHPLG